LYYTKHKYAFNYTFDTDEFITTNVVIFLIDVFVTPVAKKMCCFSEEIGGSLTADGTAQAAKL
jgi:hypothetical protein